MRNHTIIRVLVSATDQMVVTGAYTDLPSSTTHFIFPSSSASTLVSYNPQTSFLKALSHYSCLNWVG
jgi:hypothetical protein